MPSTKKEKRKPERPRGFAHADAIADADASALVLRIALPASVAGVEEDIVNGSWSDRVELRNLLHALACLVGVDHPVVAFPTKRLGAGRKGEKRTAEFLLEKLCVLVPDHLDEPVGFGQPLELRNIKKAATPGLRINKAVVAEMLGEVKRRLATDHIGNRLSGLRKRSLVIFSHGCTFAKAGACTIPKTFFAIVASVCGLNATACKRFEARFI